MALFTDGPPSSIEDLSAQDTQLLSVANIEGIDVTQKLALAWDGLGLDLFTMLNQSSTAEQAFWQPARFDLGTVVVTPALRLWHTYRALETIYADAYHNQLNDRYGGKRDHFHELAEWAQERLMSIGVGIAGLPVARAAKPRVSAVLPGGLPLTDGTYFVTTAWVNSQGEEGACGDACDVALEASTLAVNAGAAPQYAVGWNVYAGIDPGTMTLQNASPLAIGQTWVQPSPLESEGKPPGNGQQPSYWRVVVRRIQRG